MKQGAPFIITQLLSQDQANAGYLSNDVFMHEDTIEGKLCRLR
jgi:hypothetical protein